MTGAVRVVTLDPEKPFGRLEAEALNGTNLLEIRVVPAKEHPVALLVARLDNLGKGASRAAVQSMELMLGLDRSPD